MCQILDLILRYKFLMCQILDLILRSKFLMCLIQLNWCFVHHQVSPGKVQQMP